jgi:integrase
LSIEEALDRFLMTKEKTSDFHSNDLARRLKRWAETRDRIRPIHAVTKQEVESYLAQYSAQNFINHRVALSSLFDYAFKIGATPDNPVLTIEKPRIKRARPAVLDDEEYEALLNRALTQRRFDVLSWLALGGLVGLRPYEVLRLEWTGIHFQTREIRVEPGWTKTHRARIVPLQPNAFEWLKLIASRTAEKRGKVMPSASTWNNRWRRWRQEEDTPLPLRWWVGKDDVLRHSYGTYRAMAELEECRLDGLGFQSGHQVVGVEILNLSKRFEPHFRVLFSAISRGVPWGISIRVETCGSERKQKCGKLWSIYVQIFYVFSLLSAF